ncbi:diacylglycerol/lipid kinase family protein [Nocardioides yefusunii]|uniref:Diacylglycerol/lipid kinase family protein n=1 Tax=Nocardioides yefusunii TaxID=2500546 RepID=A0ABW1QWS3_9ACTN|nr:diacylglycerol kinase family protein [Nocardioides yefusunii]
MQSRDVEPASTAAHTTDVLVIQRASAVGSRGSDLSPALQVLGATGEVEVTHPASLAELEQVLAARGARTVVVAGGDGALHDVLSALHANADLGDVGRPGPCIALLPHGPDTGFARAHQLPFDLAAAARLLVEGVPTPVDLVTDDAGGVVANAVQLGAGEPVADVEARWKDRLEQAGVSPANLDRLEQPIGALATAFAPLGSRIRVEVDGKVINARQRVLSVAVGNANPDQTPGAQVLSGDGLVDVTITRAAPGTHRLAAGVLKLRGRQRQRHDVEHLRGRTVTVRSLRPDEPFSVSSDGEFESDVRTRTWHVLPGAYRLLLPESVASSVSGS